MCGEPPAPMGEEELATILTKLIERKGITVDNNETRKFIKIFKKDYKRFPDEKDLARAADEFVRMDLISKQELKAKGMVENKHQKEGLAKGQVEATTGAPARKENELDLGKKIEELRQKRALEKQQQLEMAKAKLGSRKATSPIEAEAEMPEVSAPAPEPETAAPPQAPPIPALSPAGKCPKCGASNPSDSMFCLDCGERLSGATPPAEVLKPKATPTPAAPATPTPAAPAIPAPAAPVTPVLAASPAPKKEVICPKCKNSNPVGSTFCLECGTRMEVEGTQVSAKEDTVCPGCKHVNPAGSRFCLECGNPL